MIGVTSTITGGCPTTSQHVPSWHAVELIENESGIDVTPCHDVDGTWNPGPDCGGFALDVTSGAGLSWADGCAGGPTSGLGSSCGPPYGDPPDEQPPSVEIIEPANGAEYDGPEASIAVTITVDDVDQWPTRDVTFEVSGDAGSEVSVLEEEPWDPGTLALPEGEWTMTATARDWSGNESSDTVHVYVGVPAPDNPPDDSGTDESGTDDGTDGTGDDGTDGEDTGTDPGGTNGDGCGCVTTPAPAASGFFALLIAFARRRAR
jgi:MYXO-CTERM domain-containing protein